MPQIITSFRAGGGPSPTPRPRMSNPEELPLAQNFARGLDVYTRLQSTSVDDDEISQAAAALRQAALQADRAGVLSANEVLDDIATSDLKYVLCEFYLAEVVSRTRAPNPAARAPFAAEAADALEAFLRRCEVHDLLTPEAKRQREGLKRDGGAQNADPGTARADKVARFRRERAIRARLEELDVTRRRRAEEALLNADWDDEDPDASPEDEVEERERWTLLIEDAVAKSLDNLDHLARELEMIAARDELAAARPAGRPRAGGVNARAGRGVYTLMPDGAVVPGFHDASNGSASSIGGQPTGQQTASVPPELMESLRRMYGTGVAGGSARSAERIRSEVFRPSHVLPTMTVEQAGEIEHREMMERQRAQAENAARRAREESEMTQEEREERDLAKARSWDEFKDDNPFGHGNSKLRPCS